MSRTTIITRLGALATGTALALAMPAVAHADVHGDPNIAQGDVYTTDGDVTPVAYSATDAAMAGVDGDITVSSPRRHRGVERSSIGAPIETTYARDYVSYGDLDLTTAYGRDRLMDRVSLAAKDACQRVDDRTALDMPVGDSTDCYRAAMDGTQMQMSQAVATAVPASYQPNGYDPANTGATSDDNVTYGSAALGD